VAVGVGVVVASAAAAAAGVLVKGAVVAAAVPLAGVEVVAAELVTRPQPLQVRRARAACGGVTGGVEAPAAVVGVVVGRMAVRGAGEAPHRPWPMALPRRQRVAR